MIEKKFWSGMNNGQVSAHAAKVLAEGSISSRLQLARDEAGLYRVLEARGLLDRLVPAKTSAPNSSHR